MAILIAAPLLLDMLWPVFLLLGWEHVRVDPGNTRFTPPDLFDYPWSYSLVMSMAWATAFALTYHLITRYWRGTLVIRIGVVSQWILDWTTHRPDMPLYPGGPRFGLGLWNSIAGTMAVELLGFSGTVAGAAGRMESGAERGAKPVLSNKLRGSKRRRPKTRRPSTH